MPGELTWSIQHKRDLSSIWSQDNPILLPGQIGIESDTNNFKFGNGDTWNNTPYYYNNSDTLVFTSTEDAVLTREYKAYVFTGITDKTWTCFAGTGNYIAIIANISAHLLTLNYPDLSSKFYDIQTGSFKTSIVIPDNTKYTIIDNGNFLILVP